jgi:PAS domain S-box-containing protein
MSADPCARLPRLLLVGRCELTFWPFVDPLSDSDTVGSFPHTDSSDRDCFPGGNWMCQRTSSLESGRELLLKGMLSGFPFDLVILDGIDSHWDQVWSLMDQMWERDQRLFFILSLPLGFACPLPPLGKRRNGRWMIHRKPWVEEDWRLFLACWGHWAFGGHKSEGYGSDVDGRSDGCVPSAAGGFHERVPEKVDTELELARDQLATSKSFVDNILRSMADSLFVITMDMSIGAVNPSLLTLLNYREEELLGETPGKIFGEEFAQGAIMEALLLQGSVSGVESSFLTSDGRRIPISVSGSLIQDEQGQFQGMVCVAQDITDRKRMEEEKRELHDQLLDSSRKLGMAEVASGVLHNVGNVLNSVNVSVGVIVDLLTRSLVGDIERISRMLEVHRADLGSFLSHHPKGKQIPPYLQRLSGQLLEERRQVQLEIARLRDNVGHALQCVAAQQSLIKSDRLAEPFGLSDVFEEAVLVNRDAIEEQRVEIVREFGELPQVVFDKHQILQILVALIRNGCQAMESAPVKRLMLRSRQINGPPDSIRLEVQDTGVGIPSEDLTRIFGQGYTTKKGGRGMSLHSGALTAKNLGGSLTARSDGSGTGATLILDLPGHFLFPDL